MRRTLSSRAVLQRGLATLGLAAVLVSGSAVAASASPHFSVLGPVATSYPGTDPSAPGPSPTINLTHPILPAVYLRCSMLQYNVTSAASGTIPSGPHRLLNIQVGTSTPCMSVDGYPYTITSTLSPSNDLQYDGTKFYFNMSNVTWQINGGPPVAPGTTVSPQRVFHPATYISEWQNPRPNIQPYSWLWLKNISLGTSTSAPGTYNGTGWTATVTGTWKIQQNGNLITALP